MNTANWYFPDGETKGTTVYEQDEVQLTQLLGPDGKPYAIRRPKLKMGFDLSPKK
jgi:hypothetical protein